MKRVIDRFKMNGKVAIITGASSGMSQAAASALAQMGANIVNVDIQIPSVETKKLVEIEGVKYYEVKFDLASQYLETEQVIEEVINEFGRIDVLINGAGLTRPIESLEDFNFNYHYQYIMDVNLTSVIMLCQSVIKYWIKQGQRGKIINFASSATAKQGGIRGMSYSISKAGVTIMTKSLATEYGKYGIQCNVFAPGITITPFLGKHLNHEIIQEREEHIPMGRCQETEDIMGPILFLASNASSFVNGAILRSDGGQTIV